MADTQWQAMRLATGLSQAEVERRLGWRTGHISLIERGVKPTPEREAALRRLYSALLSAQLHEEVTP